ncbi:MAG TPA: TolC family protein [Bacteroidales bacterium]|nr:TolC family protein [Bacteroidales bacterium]
MKYIIPIFLILTCSCLKAQNIITLDRAMEIAIKNSPDILKSELQMTISRENLNALEAQTKSLIRFDVSPFSYVNNREFAREGYWITFQEKVASGDFNIIQPIKLTNGSITLRNTFSYYDRFSEYKEFNTSLKGYVNDLTLSYSQPLFTYNRLKMQLKQLELALENATLSYAIQRLFLERTVNQYFYLVYQRQMALAIAREELKNQETGYEIIKSKVDGGLSAMEELYQAELNLTTSRSNLQNSIVNLANAEDDFAAYIGMPLGEDFEIQTDVNFQEVQVDLAKAIQNGLETRMELRQREITIDNSQDQLVQAKSTNEFAGNASFQIGIKGEDPVLSNIYDRPTRTPMVGLTFSIPVWDWGERRSRIKAAEAAIRIEEINLNVEKTQVELGIREAYRNLQNLVLQIEIARQNEKNAQLTYEINLERYKNGDLTGMDLNLFQNQLSTKKMDLVNSLINYRLELLNMKIQSLWDFENNISFVPMELQENLAE